MNAKYYNNRLYLSRSSSTMILDDADIPAPKEMRADNSDMQLTKGLTPVEYSEQGKALLKTCSCGRETARMMTKKGWNYPTCGGEKCKKGTTRKLRGWWCDSCNKSIEYPVLKYMLELGVSDETTHVVVVIFDETTTELVKCSADSIVHAEEESFDDDLSFPPELTNIIGSSHILELKSHTYYEHGIFESFTCWTIHAVELASDSACSSIVDAVTNPQTSLG